MAFKTIKGLTVELNGDTTNLEKALKDVDKRSRDLSGELGEINRLLKLDPGNTELLAQKQKVLASAIETTSKRLDTLKEAERQVQAQFEKGEASEEQVRALRREIVATEKKMSGYQKAAKETKNALRGVGDESKKVTEHSGKLGKALGVAAKAGLMAVATAATAAVAGLTAAAESTREYRTEMGKLDTAFTTNGHTSKAATNAYKSLQGVLGETDQAVEAANHLAKLTDNEKDLQTWTDICTGVYATFGDSLPIEGLTEAANETAKTGALTGALADALNWAGVHEESFQAKLDACSTEQERQALITETLNGLYDEAADKYRKTNAEVIRANEANEAWMSSLADVGGAIEPIITDVKTMGASLLSDLVPGVKQLAESFRGLLSGDMDASGVGKALSGIVTQLLGKIAEAAPQAAQAAAGLVTSLATSIISQLPQLLSTGVEVALALVSGLTSAVPQITQAIVTMIPQLAAALATGAPQLIQGAVDLFLAILQAIPLILPPLIAALPQIIMAVVNGLLTAIPQLLQGALQFLMAIVDAVPMLTTQLVPLIPQIVYTICGALLDMAPQLLAAAVQLLLAIAQAVPQACVALIQVLPQIWATLKAYLGQLPGRIWAILQSIVQNFGIWIVGFVANARTGFSNMLSAVVGIMGNLPSRIGEFFSQVLNNVITWGGNLAAIGREGAQELFDSIVDKIKGLPDKMLSIGKDLVTGLWNGIQNKVDWLKSKISGFVDDVMDSIKDFFGVESPSKKTAWVGKMLDEGLAVGIDKNADEPLSAMQRITQGVLQAATPDVGGLSFERQLSTSAAQAPRYGFGGASGDTSLLAKLDAIYERLDRLQVVMDSGTLVGELLDKIDNGLAANQLLKARGV